MKCRVSIEQDEDGVYVAEVPALPRDSVANVSQIITLDRTLLTERVSRVSARIMMLVEDGLRTVLAL